MKQLILIITFIPTVIYSQIEFKNFKIIKPNVVWQKIYNDSLPLQSQEIKLRAIGLPVMTTTFWLSDIDGANLVVEHKEGRTRLTVKEIYSISSTAMNFGSVQENVKKEYLEEYYLNRKGEFKKLFIRKDGKLINEIIESAINGLIEQKNDNDW